MEGGAYLSTNQDVRQNQHEDPNAHDDFAAFAESDYLRTMGISVPSFSLFELLGLPAAIPALEATALP
jgi:hypothetical protein